MDKSFEWFNQARFGLMLHWGLYTQLAGEYRGRRMNYIGEWIQSRFEIPNEEYSRLTQAMNPIGFCAEDWVKLAKSAGMEYIVLTSKHHEGFAMYKSEADPFNIADATPFGRDPIAELAEACQKHSMRLGLYYSQELDWHEPDGGGYTRGHTNHGMSWTNDWDFPDNDKKDFSRCFERKIKPQVKELLTKYGDLALIWFDTPGVITPEQSRELYDMVKAYQPHCLVNSRIGNGLGDYFSLGDNQVPAGAGAKDRLYETAATLNDTWGYKAFDQNWKTADQTISLLARLASRNTNYLLNVGPDTLGRIPAAAQDILRAVGDWMQAGGRDAVHGCEASPFPMDLSSGPVTKKGNKLYFFLNNPVPGGSFKVNGIEGQAARSYLTRQKRPLVQVQHPMRGLDGLTRLGVMLPSDVRKNDVLCVEFLGEARVPEMAVEQPDGRVELKATTAEWMGDVQVGPGGAAENWKDERAMAGWRFAVVRDGEFEISLRVSGHYITSPQLGQKLVLGLDGEEISLTLSGGEKDASLENRYYTASDARLCRASLSEGEHELSLRLAGEAAEALRLQSVRLARCE